MPKSMPTRETGRDRQRWRSDLEAVHRYRFVRCNLSQCVLSIVAIAAAFFSICCSRDGGRRHTSQNVSYPGHWFAPVNDPNKPDWEILPQEAKPGAVILSKRNE